nr:fimbrial protein [Parabacteroides goldsteinii]
MKLRNLLYATMVACAFASCSNDDDPIDNGGGNETPNAEAALEVKVATPALTKADVTDKTISSLAVLVFDVKTGRLESKGVDKEGKAGASSVIAEKITAGAKHVLVLANVESKVSSYTAGLTNGIEYSKVLNDTKTFADEVDGTLSMNSGVYDVDIQAGVTNYLGYTEAQAQEYEGHYLSQADGKTVKLYRNVAKIVLNQIQVTADPAKYKNATLDIENVFILHANKTTKLVGAEGEPWGTTMQTPLNYLNGAENEVYVGWADYMEDFEANKIIQKYLTDIKVYDYASVFSLDLSANGINGQTPWEPTTGNSSYVYENTSTDIYTLLVVQGKFKYGEVQNPASRYYSVAIGKDGITGINKDGTYDAPQGFDGSRSSLSGTVRNLQYNVDLKVAGPGYTTPFGPKAEDDTYLDVKVEVVDFGYINQSTEIE